MTNANSASATAIRFAPNATSPGLACTRLASSRPAMGPSTLMWRCPLVLVAAIFQPTTVSPAAAARARCAA